MSQAGSRRVLRQIMSVSPLISGFFRPGRRPRTTLRGALHKAGQFGRNLWHCKLVWTRQSVSTIIGC